MCYYESESKICSKTISTVNSLRIYWNLDVYNFYSMSGP